MKVVKIIPFLSLGVVALFFFLSTKNARLAKVALAELGPQSNELAYNLASRANGQLQIAFFALIVAVLSLIIFRLAVSKRG